MQTTNMTVTEKPALEGQEPQYVQKTIVALVARTHHSKTVNLPVTARGRVLHTIDCFMNGKPMLSSHDEIRTPLRRAFAG